MVVPMIVVDRPKDVKRGVKQIVTRHPNGIHQRLFAHVGPHSLLLDQGQNAGFGFRDPLQFGLCLV
jgi:hypothetical protein